MTALIQLQNFIRLALTKSFSPDQRGQWQQHPYATFSVVDVEHYSCMTPKLGLPAFEAGTRGTGSNCSDRMTEHRMIRCSQADHVSDLLVHI